MRGLEHHVPDGWRLTTFDALKAPGNYTFVGGPFGSSLTASDYVGTGVPVIRGNNLDGKNSRFIDDNFAFVTEDKADQLHSNLAYPGDLIFTQRGTLGQVGIIPDEAGYARYVVSQSQMKLTPHPELLHPWFAYYYFRSHLADAYLRHRVLATGVPHINLGILKEFPVLLPPLPEQRRIADILDKADAIRRKRQAAMKLADEFLRSAFLEMFGDPVTNPKEWPTVELESVCRRVTDGTHQSPDWSDDGVPFLFISNIIDGEIDYESKKTITEECWAELTARCPIEVNDILYTTVGSYGNAALVRTGRRFCFQRHIAHIKPDPDAIHPEFLLGQMQSDRVRRQADEQARGVAQKTLNLRELKKFSVFVPPPDMQERYVGLRREAERTIRRHRMAEVQCRVLFDSLVQRAFRGEL